MNRSFIKFFNGNIFSKVISIVENIFYKRAQGLHFSDKS